MVDNHPFSLIIFVTTTRHSVHSSTTFCYECFFFRPRQSPFFLCFNSVVRPTDPKSENAFDNKRKKKEMAQEGDASAKKIDLSPAPPNCVFSMCIPLYICCRLKRSYKLRKVERGFYFSNKFWLCCSFSIKLTTCHASTPSKSTNQRAAFLQPATNVFIARFARQVEG